MNSGEFVSSLISGIGVLILAAIGRSIIGLHKDFRRFMAEHLWLIATTLWTRDKVIQIMRRLDLPMDNPPPSDLPTVRKEDDDPNNGRQYRPER